MAALTDIKPGWSQRDIHKNMEWIYLETFAPVAKLDTICILFFYISKCKCIKRSKNMHCWRTSKLRNKDKQKGTNSLIELFSKLLIKQQLKIRQWL
jgi:hypothetical protein